MSKSKSKREQALPPILVTTDEMRRLSMLANSTMTLFPRVAHFLARELDRANVAPDDADLRGAVRMGSQVSYREDRTGGVRELVYPHEADIDLSRVSFLTPVGAALIGLSVGQAIESQTILGVSN
jgi:regulator of nucleoside diphosphate kinase